jgi:DNA modification methylase
MTAPAQYFLDGKVLLYAGDCLDVLPTLPENSLDACVCDPPYHLTSIVQRFGKDDAAAATGDHASGAFARASRGFMGQQWDGGDIAFRPEVWRQVLRVLKPGAHLLAFGSSRGFGRMQVAIEDAGFETRDCILELLDSDPRVVAFVNSLDDAQRVAFLQIVVESSDVGGLMAWLFGSGFPKSHTIAHDFEKQLCRPVEQDGRTVWRYISDNEVMARKAPFRDIRANRWAGFGTAQKPAFEPIVMARKPLIGSVAENVEAFGTGALNIDAIRIAAGDAEALAANWARHADNDAGSPQGGRWPANVITDGSAAALDGFPETGASQARTGKRTGRSDQNGWGMAEQRDVRMGHDDAGGSAGRFYYSAKADASDRIGSNHPTVKPVDLMQYLVRAVTAKGQTVLDLFAGTGTTGEAAWREGRKAVLIEREAKYRTDIARRMALCLAGPDERKRESIKAKIGDQPFEAGSLFAEL